MSEANLKKFLNYYEILSDASGRDQEYKKALKKVISFLKAILKNQRSYQEYRSDLRLNIKTILSPSEVYVRKIKKFNSLAPVTRAHFHIFEWLAKNRVLSPADSLRIISLIIKSCKCHNTSQKTPLFSFKLFQRLGVYCAPKRAQADEVLEFFFHYCNSSEKGIRVSAFKTLQFLCTGRRSRGAASHADRSFFKEHTAYLVATLVDFATFSDLRASKFPVPLNPLLSLRLLLAFLFDRGSNADEDVVEVFHLYAAPKLLRALAGAQAFEKLHSLRFDPELFPQARTRHAPQIYLPLALNALCFPLITTAPGRYFGAEIADALCAFAQRCDDFDFAPSGQTALRLVCANERLVEQSVVFSVGQIFDIAHANEAALTPDSNALEVLLLCLSRTLFAGAEENVRSFKSLPPFRWMDDGLQHFYALPAVPELRHAFAESNPSSPSCLSECCSTTPDPDVPQSPLAPAKFEALQEIPYEHMVLESFLSLLQRAVFFAQNFVTDPASLRPHVALHSLLSAKDFLLRLFRKTEGNWLCYVSDILVCALEVAERLVREERSGAASDETLLGFLKTVQSDSVALQSLNADQLMLDLFQLLHLIAMKSASKHVREYTASRLSLFVLQFQDTVTPFLWSLFHRFALLQGMTRKEEPVALRVLGAQACLFRYTESRRDYLPFLRGLVEGIFSDMGPAGRCSAHLCRLGFKQSTLVEVEGSVLSVCGFLDGYFSAVSTSHRLAVLRQQTGMNARAFVKRSHAHMLRFFGTIPQAVLVEVWRIVQHYCERFTLLKWRRNSAETAEDDFLDEPVGDVQESARGIVDDFCKKTNRPVEVLNAPALKQLARLFLAIITSALVKQSRESSTQSIFGYTGAEQPQYFRGMLAPFLQCISSFPDGFSMMSELLELRPSEVPTLLWEDLAVFLGQMVDPLPLLRVVQATERILGGRVGAILAHTIGNVIVCNSAHANSEKLVRTFFESFAQASLGGVSDNLPDNFSSLSGISMRIICSELSIGARITAFSQLFQVAAHAIARVPAPSRRAVVDTYLLRVPLQLLRAEQLLPEPVLGIDAPLSHGGHFPKELVLNSFFEMLCTALSGAVDTQEGADLWAAALAVVKILSGTRGEEPITAVLERCAASAREREGILIALFNAEAVPDGAFELIVREMCALNDFMVSEIPLGRAMDHLDVLLRFEEEVLMTFHGFGASEYLVGVGALLTHEADLMRQIRLEVAFPNRDAFFSVLARSFAKVASFADRTVCEQGFDASVRDSVWLIAKSGMELADLRVLCAPPAALEVVYTALEALLQTASDLASFSVATYVRPFFEPFLSGTMPDTPWNSGSVSENDFNTAVSLLSRFLTTLLPPVHANAVYLLWEDVIAFLRAGVFFDLSQPLFLVRSLIECRLPASAVAKFFQPGSLLFTGFSSLDEDQPTTVHLHVLRPIIRGLADTDPRIATLREQVDRICDLELITTHERV